MARPDFPLPLERLPEKLRALLTPVGKDDPHVNVEVAASFEHDRNGAGREMLHMLMLAIPADKVDDLGVPDAAASGVVGGPVVEEAGIIKEYALQVAGADPIVMAWGTGSFFAYNLSEKVWMSLGLSPRAIGNEKQRLVYDDQLAPEVKIAEGEISNSYHFGPSREVSWKMRNDYLRRYLWLRGAVGARVFFYEGFVADCAEVRALMARNRHYLDEQTGNWYVLDLRTWADRILMQVWASVPIVSGELCPVPDTHALVWPGDEAPMTEKRLAAAARIYPIYLRDAYLERFEKNSIYDTVPMRTPDDDWYCGPSYKGQWMLSARRVGRNLIRTDAHELYKNLPAREVVYAHGFAVAPAVAKAADGGEHVVAKCRRLLDALLNLSDNLSALGPRVGVALKDPEELVGFNRAEVGLNGWLNYPRLCRLAQVAPADMTQQAFLARCKTLHEVVDRIPRGYLKALLRRAGVMNRDLNRQNVGSLKLTQGVLNILDSLNASADDVTGFIGAAGSVDWTQQNPALTPLFVANDLRIGDAHELPGDWLQRLEELGYDSAEANDGYGSALDLIFDTVVEALVNLDGQIRALLQRS